MSKPKSKAPEGFTGIAVAAFKVGDSGGLVESVELVIVDGAVVSETRLCRGGDMPSVAIGNATRMLWKTYKVNKGEAQ